MLRFGFSVVLLCTVIPIVSAQSDDLDRAPILYKTTKADNSISALQKRLDAGTVKLALADERGYLPAVLKALNIRESSQILVFSKTSLQRDRISPKTPRAIYFNDDAAVGFCLRGDMLELSAADPNLGTAFYTLDQEPAAKPGFERRRDDCLTCHATPATGGVPGHLVRSVFTDRSGLPILSAGSHRTDHTSPFSERWGGWYVTGTHGDQKHMGNWIVSNAKEPTAEGNADGQNVVELKSRFTVANYLTPHSDIVALLVFEHQTGCQNRIAQAMVTTKQALHYEASLNREFGEPADKRWDSAVRRIDSAAEELVRHLLFAREAKLEGAVAGTSDFAKEFTARGPFDTKGRSLREFDLRTRLFKYPCSYLIYSKTFGGLPAEVKALALKRLHDVLTGKDKSEVFAHLSAADRQAILEILRDTLDELPFSGR